MLPLARLLPLALILWMAGAAAAQTGKVSLPTPLTQAAEVARYPETDPELQPTVRIEGTVTFIDPSGTVFLQDSSGATFIRNSPLGRTMRPGMRLRVTGTRYPGLYIGGIIPEKVEQLGESPLPAPLKISASDLATGRFHYQLVEVEGVGRSMEVTGENSATLRLNTPGGVVDVLFDQNPPEDTHDFVDAAVKVQGLAAGGINDRRQLVLPYVRAADVQAVRIITPPMSDPFDQPAIPMATLLDSTGADAAPLHRVKVQGVALSSTLGGGFFMREGSRSLFVHSRYQEPLQPGDVVEALGFPQMGAFSAQLADAVFRVTGQEEPPYATTVVQRTLVNGSCDSDLITVEAKILQKTGNENAWMADAFGVTFKIIAGPLSLPDFEPGSTVRFTGPCRVSATRNEGYRALPTAYELWLRSADDVVLVTAPTWWNSRRLVLALTPVAGAAFMAAAWAALLKRQVNRQLALLQTKAQAEAVLEERQRIAREFHDTLEQELAGLHIRLEAATPRVADDKARELLEQQRKLLGRLQTETRDFVWDLRDASRNEAPLPEALRSLLDHLQSTTTVTLVWVAEGTRAGPEASPPSLPPLVQHHLLRITREAVNNAVKYAAPSQVKVTLFTDDTTLNLQIADDGKGFDPEAEPRAGGHFGLQGMRERARKLHATLTIESRPGKGTRVGLALALAEVRASFT